MSPSAIKTIIFASAVVLLGSLSDSVEAHKVRGSVKAASETCNKCKSPDDWSSFTGVCFHDRGDRTNWFIRKSGGRHYSQCGCCKVDSWTNTNAEGKWGRVTLNENVYCDFQEGSEDIGDWYWKSSMYC